MDNLRSDAGHAGGTHRIPNMDGYEPMDVRQAQVQAYLDRKQEETERLAALITSLQSQLLSVVDTRSRERLHYQIEAKETQLQRVYDELEKQKARAAEIFRSQ